MQRQWMAIGAAMVIGLGTGWAQTDGSVADTLAHDEEAREAGEPRFELALGRSPTQAGFALDIAGGRANGWALLALRGEGGAEQRALVALDANGEARVVRRNYEAAGTVEARCSIPRPLGVAGSASVQAQLSIPPAAQLVQAPQLAQGPGTIVITEIMKDPSFVTDSMGEWFEVRNRTAQPIDLTGWVIRDTTGSQHTINSAAGVIVPPRSYFVLGVNSNASLNGGITIGYKYSSFTLGNAADDIQLFDAAGVLVDAVAYDDGVFWPDQAGKSLNVERSMIDPSLNDDGTNWCSALTPISASNTDLGTPRVANNTCP